MEAVLGLLSVAMSAGRVQSLSGLVKANEVRGPVPKCVSSCVSVLPPDILHEKWRYTQMGAWE
jgi:hypothetical protein